MKNSVKTSVWACLGLFVLVAAPVSASAAGAMVPAADDGPLAIVLGESTIVTSPWPTVRVAVTDPTIANVQILAPDQVLLQGLKVGSTDLILWGEEDQTLKRKIETRLDLVRFQGELAEFFPLAQLTVAEAGDTLVVRGFLRSVDQAKLLHAYLDSVGVKYVDMTTISGVHQVQIQVRVAEVSRTALRTMGINFFWTDDSFFGASRVGSSGGPLVPGLDIGPASGQVAGNDTVFEWLSDGSVPDSVTLFAGWPKMDLEFFINALAENQYLRILANPTLVAMSGESADFLAGGEFPIPVVQGSGGGGNSSVTIEYREYGVRLMFDPLVLGDGTINLHALQEVSELTNTGATTRDGFLIPGLTTRRAETTLQLKSGQTFAMAGLIRNKTGANLAKFPGLGDLPVLGPLFRSVRYSNEETELVILVTASLVEPLSISDAPPLPGFLHSVPDDWEFYIEGHIDGEEPAKIDPATAKWLKDMGLNELFGPGAWDAYTKPEAASEADIVPVEEAAEE